MKKIFLASFVFCMAIIVGCSDDDNIINDNQFNGEVRQLELLGGSAKDVARAVIPTNDGGFAVLATAESVDVDLQGKAWPGADYWLLKYDTAYNLEWDKTYGGTDDDQAHDLVQTADGGYALIGYSKSDDGDASNNEGFHDNWIVKVDAQGNFEWEQSFGFLGHDHSYSILQFDDGYAIGGFLDVTASEGEGATDRSNLHGVGEFWVHRLDLQGNIIWRKYFGGTHDEKIYGLAKADDGGIILAGYTESPDFDISENNGTYDFWAVKVDATGEMVWENAYGGQEFETANSITKGPNNTYLLAGSARSTDGDVSTNYGNSDMWVIAIDDNGNLLWENNYGGSQFDTIHEISPAIGGGYWIAGDSRSDDIDLDGNAGQNDAVLMKLSATGDIEFTKRLAGSNFDFGNDVKEIKENVVVFVGETDSNDLDFSGNNGDYDAFIAVLD